jgi:tRNA-2-methylthio-N6-dimethylallyladenosine synthase
MNEHDSEKVAGVLLARGYKQVYRQEDAGVILYNTCSIREKAAQKVYSRLGELRPVERSGESPFDCAQGRRVAGGEVKEPQRDPSARDARSGRAPSTGARIIGVLGCLAQQEGERIFARAPWVSLVCGSASYRKLPQLIEELEAGNRRVTGLDTDTDETFETEVTRRDNPWRAYLTIIEGCDKACSYCVVPFTRGPERSRTSASILEEVRKLAGVGYTEVQLLGQTVNSYADPSTRKMRFSELLVAVAEVKGIRRVRFTTSHPRDFGKDIVEAIEAVPGICEHVHLPVQSGSTRILKAMARTYTREEYLEKVAMLRAAKREISLTTDIIVGFPGETEKDFEETLSLLDAAEYDGAFSFKYSPRPNTPSLKMEDAIPEEEKSRRLAILIERQREIQRARNERLVGKSFEVMVEGKSRRELQWSGHTSSNKVMNFTSTREESLGDYVQVRVTGVTPNSLVGERVGAEGDRSVEGSFGELVAGVPPLRDPARKERAEEKAGSLRSG